MKREIARLANRLCELLELCDDENFVDIVRCTVSCNDPIDLDKIEDD